MMIIGIGPNESPIEALLAAIKQAGGTCGDPNCESCGEAKTGTVIGTGTADGSKAQAQGAVGVDTAGSHVSADISYIAKDYAQEQGNATRIARARVYGDVASYVGQQLRGLQLHQIEVEHDRIKSADSPALVQARIDTLRNLRALLEAKATA